MHAEKTVPTAVLLKSTSIFYKHPFNYYSLLALHLVLVHNRFHLLAALDLTIITCNYFTSFFDLVSSANQFDRRGCVIPECQ